MIDTRRPQQIVMSLILLLVFFTTIQSRVGTTNTAIGTANTTPSTISTDTWDTTTMEPFQRKAFYAYGRYWVFYAQGPETMYKTSFDGLTWSQATFACQGGPYAGRFSLWFDGDYIHYARSTSIPTESIMYRKGRPNQDGTISWSTLEQTVLTITDLKIYEPFIAIDSEGYPWIGYRWGTNGDRYPNCTKSSLNNGTWETALGFPHRLSSLSIGNWAVSIVPLTQQKMYVVYVSLGAVRGKLWNGTTFETEELIAPASIAGRTRFAHSVLAREDDVYVAFLNLTLTNKILFLTRTYSMGWSEQVTIQSSVADASFPVLSIDLPNNELCCFWADNDTIYYKKSKDDSWDSDPTTWVTEGDLVEDTLSCFYQAWKSRIGVIWNRGKNYIYNVRFFSLATGDITPPSIENVHQQPTEDNVYPTDEVEICANVTDDTSGIKQVILNYTVDNNESFTVNMESLQDTLYNATIPQFPYCTNITYMLIAEDNANNTITTKEMGYEYQYHVIAEFPLSLVLLSFMTAGLATLIIKRTKSRHLIH